MLTRAAFKYLDILSAHTLDGSERGGRNIWPDWEWIINLTDNEEN